MQTTIISSITSDCSDRLYFFIKESDYILSEVRSGVLHALSGGFGKGKILEGVGRKLFPTSEM